MKIRIKRLSVSQCAKMVAALYFVFSLPLLLVFMLLAPLLGQAPFGFGALILFPFLYAFVSYLGGRAVLLDLQPGRPSCRRFRIYGR